MRILLKYAWKNMMEKKGRFFLLLIVVSLSTGLFLGGQKSTEGVIETNQKIKLETFENRIIGISSRDSQNEIILADVNKDVFKDIISEIRISNLKTKKLSENTVITLIGRKSDDLPQNSEFLKGKKEDITGNKIIVSERMSKKTGKQIGDELIILVNQKDIRVEIAGVVKNSAVFYSDQKNSFVFMMDQTELENLTQIPLNFVIAKPIDSKKADSIIKEFNQESEALVAYNRIDNDQIKTIGSRVTGMFMFIFALFTSVLIIVGVFRLIIMERLKTVGTFFSQGASWHQIRLIFVLESIIYGLLGGFVGILIGYGINFAVNYIASPLKEFGIYEKPGLEWTMILMGFIFSVSLSTLSVLASILKIRKLSVKDIILQELVYDEQISVKKLVIGFLLIIVASIVAILNLDFWWLLLAILAGFIGFMLIYAKVVEFFMAFIFKKLKNKTGIAALASQNVGTSKMIRSNVALTTIAILVLVMINSIGVSFRSILNETDKGIIFDVSIKIPATGIENQKERIQKEIEASSLIEQTSNITHGQMISTVKIDNMIVNLTGIENIPNYRNYNKFMEFKVSIFDNGFQVLDSEENTFMSTKTYAETLNLKKGDSVMFDFGSETKKFKLVEIYDNKTGFNSILTKSDNIPDSLRLTVPTMYFYQSKASPEETKNELKKVLKDFNVEITTKKEQTDKNKEQNEIVISIFNVLALIITIIIGSFGILSNITIAFLQRKKQMALYESVGITKLQLVKLIFWEDFFVWFISICLSIPLLVLQINLVEQVLNIMIGATLNVSINLKSLPLSYLFIFLLVLVASIPAILGTRKIKIINELKND